MTPEQKKQHVLDVRQEQDADKMEYSSAQNLYVTLSFATEEAKVAFCEVLGVETDGKFIRGEDVLEMLH